MILVKNLKPCGTLADPQINKFHQVGALCIRLRLNDTANTSLKVGVLLDGTFRTLAIVYTCEIRWALRRFKTNLLGNLDVLHHYSSKNKFNLQI
jgi:hypothetical protein